jgi:hypothetical protein
MNPKGTPANLKPFTKGDKRINRKGKPKDFTALRQLAQTIAHEDISDGMTVTEAILRKWAGSKDPRLQLQFMEVAFGKVPSAVEVSGKNGKDIPIVVVQPGLLDGLK